MVTKKGLWIDKGVKDKIYLDDNYLFNGFPQVGNATHYGLSTCGGKLLYGKTILVNDGVSPVITENDGNVSFGDVEIIKQGTCVNITEEDFVSLLDGDIPSGYCRYRKDTIYNIVSDVSTAPVITYTISNGTITFSTGKSTTDLGITLYNNVPTLLSDNTEDKTATVTSTRCPFINLRHFDHIVNKNSPFEIEYHVDNIDNDWFNNNVIEDTFTVEIADLSGIVLAKRTTYGGVHRITVPAYLTVGEKEFTVRCVDSHGVSSPMEFMRVLVVETTNDVIADMEDYLDQDGNISFEYPVGTAWTITLKDEDKITKQEAYQNKGALSAFFAMASSNGATRVKFYNSDDTHYYIDYHTQSGISATCVYYKCTMDSAISSSTKTIVSVEEVSYNEVYNAKLVSKLTPVIRVTAAPVAGDTLKANDTTGDTSQEVWFCTLNSLGTLPSGGDNIVFPDNITIDLNGSTIKAIPTNDIVRGTVLKFQNNFNTHVINGKVYGNYENFDFYATSINCGNVKPAEWLGVTDISGSRFCSFRNLEIGWSVGYDGGVFSACTNFGSPVLIDNKRIDLTSGEEVEDTSMIVTDFKNCSGKNYIALGRIGYCGYQCAGTQREIFFSFYDANQNYIKSYKSRLYLHVKVPENAVYVRITGYGNVYSANGDTSMAAWSVQWRGSSENGSLALFDVKPCDSCFKTDCYHHDTRTIAHQGAGYCYLIDNCTYERIGKEIGHPSGWDAVTPLLADLEDDFQWHRNFTMRNCERIGTGGRDLFIVHYCTVFNFVGNTGISLTNTGGIEAGLIADSYIPSLKIDKNHKSLHPHVMYDGNVIGGLSVTITDYTATGEHVDEELVIKDSVLERKNNYSHLLMRNSINGEDVYQ